MDRFDCQLLMATFVHVYQSSFIKWVKVLSSFLNHSTTVVGMPEDAMQRKTIDRMASFGTF